MGGSFEIAVPFSVFVRLRLPSIAGSLRVLIPTLHLTWVLSSFSLGFYVLVPLFLDG